MFIPALIWSTDSCRRPHIRTADAKPALHGTQQLPFEIDSFYESDCASRIPLVEARGMACGRSRGHPGESRDPS